MPQHDMKCGCGFRGSVFFHAKDGPRSVPCPDCSGMTLEVDWSDVNTRPKWERQWDGEKAISHEFACDPSLVKAYRERLGKFSPRAANMLRDSGDVVHMTRKDSREFQKAVTACQRQDEEDSARLQKSGV